MESDIKSDIDEKRLSEPAQSSEMTKDSEAAPRDCFEKCTSNLWEINSASVCDSVCGLKSGQ